VEDGHVVAVDEALYRVPVGDVPDGHERAGRWLGNRHGIEENEFLQPK
jgi:hypothetical protein